MALRLVSKTLFKINNSETSVFPALVGAESKKDSKVTMVKQTNYKSNIVKALFMCIKSFIMGKDGVTFSVQNVQNIHRANGQCFWAFGSKV